MSIASIIILLDAQHSTAKKTMIKNRYTYFPCISSNVEFSDKILNSAS